MYKRILVAFDGSKPSHRGLEEAIHLAQSLGSQIRLVHVVNETPWLGPHASAALMHELLAELRSTSKSMLSEASNVVRAAGIEVDIRLLEAVGDQAGEYVVREAASWPAELIACGTHGRRGLRRIIMGSDAEYIVRHSSVPVLLVRAEAD